MGWTDVAPERPPSSASSSSETLSHGPASSGEATHEGDPRRAACALSERAKGGGRVWRSAREEVDEARAADRAVIVHLRQLAEERPARVVGVGKNGRGAGER